MLGIFLFLKVGQSVVSFGFLRLNCVGFRGVFSTRNGLLGTILNLLELANRCGRGNTCK